MKKQLLFTSLIVSAIGFGQYAPAAGEEGTTAVHKDSSAIVNWANGVESFERGLEDIAFPEGDLASFGDAENALYEAEGNSTDVVSLGDNGSIVLTFPYPIRNGEGADFAVFENSFSNTYLELAHVEVSSDGERFVRIPSVSLTPTDDQTGPYENSDPTKVHNLAGKYIQGYGTPFDLEDIIDSTGIDLENVQYVKIIDVIGTVDEAYASVDSDGNIINDPYPTDFESGGFDLDAVAVMNENNPFAHLNENQMVSQVYPNPSTNTVFWKSSVPVKKVQLFDFSGKLVLSIENSNNELNWQALGVAPGMYVLQLESEKNSEIHREKVHFLAAN